MMRASCFGVVLLHTHEISRIIQKIRGRNQIGYTLCLRNEYNVSTEIPVLQQF
jgi:hypothetical protein